MQGLAFAWDAKKAAANLHKHRIGFAEASTVFADPLSVTIPDRSHEDEEDRFVIIGMSRSRRLLVVVHTVRGERLRLITARPATTHEKYQYEESSQ